MTETCPVCGAEGACALDAGGRPLIHTDAELPSKTIDHEADSAAVQEVAA